MHAMGPPRQRTRYFCEIMNEHSNEVRIALLKQRIQQLEAERDNALPFYKTRLAKAREAMIQMEAEIAELKLSLDSRNRERDNALSDFRQADTDSIRALHERNEARGQRDALAEALIEMRYGHTDKAEEMAVKALNYLAK